MPRRPPPGVEVRKAADGTVTYRIRWRQGGGRDGRRLSHTFTRQGEAVDALRRIASAGWTCHCPQHAPDGISTKHFGAPLPPTQPKAAEVSFGAFAARHVASLTGVGPGYRARFAREMELHFAPFADQPIAAITEMEVREWIRGMEDGTHPWLLRGPSSPTTIRRLLTQAGAVLAAAQTEGIATRNPFRGHRVGRRDRDRHTEMVVLTQEEAALLLEALPAGVPRDLVTVILGTGMRWGEATALGPGHVDPFATPPVLHVARAWQDDGQGGYRLGTPKSRRSRRTVDFSAAVLEALIPHLAGAGDFVFTTQRGRPLRHSNFYHRVWLPALDRANAAGLGKRPRIHDLRHTHASWLIAGGMDIAAVSRRLGHETTALTSDTYYHLMPKTRSDALAILDAALPVTPRGPGA